MPETRITALLKADGTVAAITTRVQPVKANQAGSFPLITYQRISTSPVNHATGTTDTTECRIQVDCWAETYVGSKALADAVRGALSGVADGSGDPQLSMIHLVSEIDLPESPDPGEDTTIYRVSQDYLIWYNPAPA